MAQPGDGAALLAEALQHPRRPGDVGLEHLDRQAALQIGVEDFVDLGEPTLRRAAGAPRTSDPAPAPGEPGTSTAGSAASRESPLPVRLPQPGQNSAASGIGVLQVGQGISAMARIYGETVNREPGTVEAGPVAVSLYPVHASPYLSGSSLAHGTDDATCCRHPSLPGGTDARQFRRQGARRCRDEMDRPGRLYLRRRLDRRILRHRVRRRHPLPAPDRGRRAGRGPRPGDPHRTDQPARFGGHLRRRSQAARPAIVRATAWWSSSAIGRAGPPDAGPQVDAGARRWSARWRNMRSG